MQFCFTGQDPTSLLQNLDLKVVYIIRTEQHGEKKDEGKRGKTGLLLLLLCSFRVQLQIKVVMEGLGAIF